MDRSLFSSQLASCSTNELLTPQQWRALADALSLSRRESEVAQLLLESLSEEDIALQLGIARRTVHAHIEKTYRRLGIHSRTDLILRIFREYIRLQRPTTRLVTWPSADSPVVD